MGVLALAGFVLSGAASLEARPRDPAAPREEPSAVDPEALAAAFLADPAMAAEVLPRLAEALVDNPGGEVARRIAGLGRALSRRVAAREPRWSEDQLDLLLTTQLVHPLRFVEEPSFRDLVGREVLPAALDPMVPAALRDALLGELNTVRGVDFEISERVELAWGAARRSSAEREVPPSTVAGAKIPANGAIRATVLSLPSATVAVDEASALLAALQKIDPARQLLVASDGSLLRALADEPLAESTYLLDTHGRAYSPWPRDPLLIAHRPPTLDEGILLIARPNRQPGRESDGDLARELVQQLPEAIDASWGRVVWTTAPVPFHNGNILLADGQLWLSLHSLEQPILQRLGLERVPVASFDTVEGLERYVAAARHEAERLGTLFARPARFVHRLPTVGETSAGETMARLGGGAGFDLDSLLSFVPAPPDAPDGPSVALVADLDLGLAMLDGHEADEGLEELRETYGITAPIGAVRGALSELAHSTRGRRLDAFLETVADHLAGEAGGRQVERLPLLLVPTSLLPGEPLEHADFVLGWNNMVFGSGPAGVRAEAFAGGFPPGDRLVRQVLTGLGIELVLLPPLTSSIVRNGGYRCASNHLREPHDTRSAEASQPVESRRAR